MLFRSEPQPFHRQLRQAGIRADETAEALRARRDDVQAAPHVVTPVVRQGVARENALQAAGTSVWATVTKAAVVSQKPLQGQVGPD